MLNCYLIKKMVKTLFEHVVAYMSVDNISLLCKEKVQKNDFSVLFNISSTFNNSGLTVRLIQEGREGRRGRRGGARSGHGGKGGGGERENRHTHTHTQQDTHTHKRERERDTHKREREI